MKSKTNKSKHARGNPHIAELGRATQFQPGQSPNPGGRPSWTPYADAHREVAGLTVHELGVLPTDSVARATAKSVARQALKGNISAAAEAANRAEGTPRQRPEVSAVGPQEVVWKVVFQEKEITNPDALRGAHLKRSSDQDSKPEEAADSLAPPDGDGEPE
jgi:hypothetical protein